MKLVLVVLVSLICITNIKCENIENKASESSALSDILYNQLLYDIQPGISARFFKDPGHESITNHGYKRVHKNYRKVLSMKALKSGVIYNDMPGNDGDSTPVLRFTRRFVLSKLMKDNAVSRSHYGCQQHWHSMGPVAQRNGAEIVFDNGDVRNLILQQMKYWYMQAFEELFKFAKCKYEQKCESTDERIKAMKDAVQRSKTTLSKIKHILLLGANYVREKYRSLQKRFFHKLGNLADLSDFRIGHILHTLQDSYANGHTIRDRNTPNDCGKIVLFQGYAMQAGRTFHGNADHIVGSKTDEKAGSINSQRRAELLKCAEDQTYAFLLQWSYCKAKLLEDYKKKHKDNTSVWNAKTMLEVFKNIHKSKDGVYKDLIHTCRFQQKWFDRNYQLAEGVAKQQAGGANSYSSSFYNKDKNIMKKNIEESESPIEYRDINVIYNRHPKQHVHKKPFVDCDEVNETDGTCKMRIYQPKFDFKGDTVHANHATALGHAKVYPKGVDYDDTKDKHSICSEQMSHRDKIWWEKQEEKQKLWDTVLNEAKSAYGLTSNNHHA